MGMRWPVRIFRCRRTGSRSHPLVVSHHECCAMHHVPTFENAECLHPGTFAEVQAHEYECDSAITAKKGKSIDHSKPLDLPQDVKQAKVDGEKRSSLGKMMKAFSLGGGKKKDASSTFSARRRSDPACGGSPSSSNGPSTASTPTTSVKGGDWGSELDGMCKALPGLCTCHTGTCKGRLSASSATSTCGDVSCSPVNLSSALASSSPVCKALPGLCTCHMGTCRGRVALAEHESPPSATASAAPTPIQGDGEGTKAKEGRKGGLAEWQLEVSGLLASGQGNT